jgi:hypothetical protein
MEFIVLNKNNKDRITEPLAFWTAHAAQFPILARFARRTFACSATSADAERLFSHAGDVCTPDRNSLSAESINMLTTCNLHLRRQLGIEDKRNAGSSDRLHRFTILNVKLECESPTNLDDLIDEADDMEDPDFGSKEDQEDD